MKTIKQHLETLKEPYKTKALSNTYKEDLDYTTDDLVTTLHIAFAWPDSPEGTPYWSDVVEQVDKQNPNYFEIQSS